MNAEFKPFAALRYNPDKAGPLCELVAPPYDVIPPERQAALHERSPFNVVRLMLGYQRPADNEHDNRYTRASCDLGDWIARGVLVRERQPALYALRHEFDEPGRGRRVRWGVLGLLRLDPLDAGSVIPHERTLTAPRTDRINLIRACRGQLEPVFCLFGDAAGEARQELARAVEREPDWTTRLDGDDLAVWILTDGPAQRICATISQGPAFIADGHHRYSAALTVHRELVEQGFDRPGGRSGWILTYMTAFEEPGLLVLPTHRGVLARPGLDLDALERALRERFDVREMPFDELVDPQRLAEFQDGAGAPECEFLVALAGRPNGLHLRLPRAAAAGLFGPDEPTALVEMDVALLHRAVLERMLGIGPAELAAGGYVKYYRDAAEMLDELRCGGALAAAFVVRPLSMRQVALAAEQRVIFPQKATYFQPKVPSGLVFHLFEE